MKRGSEASTDNSHSKKTSSDFTSAVFECICILTTSAYYVPHYLRNCIFDLTTVANKNDLLGNDLHSMLIGLICFVR